MQILEKGNKFVIVFSYNPRLVNAVKRLPGAQFDWQKKWWYVLNVNGNRQRVEQFAHQYGFQMAEQVVEKPFDKPLPDMPKLNFTYEQLSRFLKLKPYEYQLDGIAYCLTRKRAIIGDQPGLGKTAQAIAAVTIANQFPCLVICTSSLKENWRREFAMWTNKKAVILNDSNKNTWHMFAKGQSLFGQGEAGMAQVFITNYESLKKFFVTKIEKPEKGKLTLKHVRFSPYINLFKSVIIDESHKCFTYDTKVLTNKGWLKIGDIVENKMQNLFVASMNLSSKIITFKPILNFWKNEKQGRVLHRIEAGGCVVDTTEDHKIYVDGQGWKEAISLRNTENLYVLQEEFLDEKSWERDCDILRKKLCCESGKCKPVGQIENGQKQEKAEATQNMSMVREGFCTDKQSEYSKQRPFLFSKLFCKMEVKPSRNKSNKSKSCEKREVAFIGNEANAELGFAQNALRKNEEKKSNEQSRYCEKNGSVNGWKNVPFSWWKWSINRTSEKTVEIVEFTRRIIGICYKHTKCQASFQIRTESLQSGYCINREENSNRNRRVKPQNEEMEISGQKENGNFRIVRVESNTVLERGYYERHSNSDSKNQYLYDLEIAYNHNYFANGILVSNCKDASTQQTKFTKALATGKEYVFALTGTPVVNKPVDLASQLSIIGQIDKFGGYQNYLKNYCAGFESGHSNLKELNWMLHTHCFFRREKKDVLKDLPDKVRQVVYCDIINRKEYNDALADLELYLKKYRQADDAQIARSMKGEVMVRIGILKNISARGKLNDVVEYISDIVEAGEKIVVFIHLKEVAQYLKKMFPAAVTITGEDNNVDRQKAVDSFQKDPDCQVIICSIKAAGVGLTLTASSRVAFVELPWHPADTEQCEDRCHRIGQKDSVQCTYFLGRDTIDEWVYQIIDEKRSISNQITGARDEVEVSVMDSVINLFNNNSNESKKNLLQKAI